MTEVNLLKNTGDVHYDVGRRTLMFGVMPAGS